MDHFKINTRDLFFILKAQLNYGQLCDFDRYKDLDEKALDLLVNEAVKFARGVVAPLQALSEDPGVTFGNNQVACPPAFKTAFKKYGQDGWTAAARDLEYGGSGFPLMMRIVVNDIMYGACQSFNMAPSLTHGAAHLIESFASDDLKALFVPKMFDGTWAGTMALTEPGAGSDLGALEASARRENDHYKLKGTKIFISWGDHDLTDNIVHLVLARIDGAPPGIKGISLFIVPKYRVNPDGSPGESNDVICGGIEAKLGLHGSPTCTLNFGTNDGCEAYLCGEENRGLAHMFQMMNQARINTGVSGMAIAATAYQNVLAYARERRQGRDLTGRQSGSVPIIQHPDVKRMLLWMKAVTDGMRSLVYTAAFWSDMADQHPDASQREHYTDLLDFFTPIVKAYCSDMGFRVCETAMQCMGGYGYIKDFPVEQYLRDVKILSLYEGTNGIQAMDLMGRKMRIKDGTLLTRFSDEIMRFCRSHADYGPVNALEHATREIVEGARQLGGLQSEDPLLWGANATPALMCLSEVAVCWRLLDMAVIAAQQIEAGKGPGEFYEGKIRQARFFAETVLPHSAARMKTCLKKGRDIADIPLDEF
ncbi:MAG: acyl-CoA dehydrogenase [Thermodesulfobacteriota bacterium]|nr:acyl-CoA dehydrogenase [Thermodesulfobacteriota bacterium]